MPSVLLLFDIDKTLVPAMGTISTEMVEILSALKARGLALGVVGGSDRDKAVKQLGPHILEDVMDVCFHENGAVVYIGKDHISSERLEDYVSPVTIRRLVNACLALIAECPCPWKTGTFIERRNCMLNVSPIGRACTQEQRERFAQWDLEVGARRDIVEALRTKFPDLPMEMAIGGQISIDIFPVGFNKTLALKHIPEGLYDAVHFFGDSVDKGGNDYELYSHHRVIGHRVTGPDDTQKQLTTLLNIL